MICTNIYPPKNRPVNNVFLSSEKQDLSDFLSQWYLKYKQTKTKKTIGVFLQSGYSFVLALTLKKKKKEIQKNV